MTRIIADLNLHRRSLHDPVVERPRAPILDGMSHTSLRDAIEILSTDGGTARGSPGCP